MGFVNYVLLKLILYSFWCTVGIWMFRNATGNELWGGIKFGAFRTGIGIITGVSFTLIAHTFDSPAYNNESLMRVILIPTRWMEWSIIAVILQKLKFFDSLRDFFLGKNLKDRLWRVLGIVVSFGIDTLADRGYLGSFFVC
jgi:hypothetical protein